MVVCRLNKGFQKMARVSVGIEFVTIGQSGEAGQSSTNNLILNAIQPQPFNRFPGALC